MAIEEFACMKYSSTYTSKLNSCQRGLFRATKLLIFFLFPTFSSFFSFSNYFVRDGAGPSIGDSAVCLSVLLWKKLVEKYENVVICKISFWKEDRRTDGHTFLRNHCKKIFIVCTPREKVLVSSLNQCSPLFSSSNLNLNLVYSVIVILLPQRARTATRKTISRQRFRWGCR